MLGVATGVFFGEMVADLQIVGTAFIRLLQMTVIPYIVVSLIGGLGRLSFRDAKNLAFKGGAVLLTLWGLGIGLILLVPLAFPDWPSASFFTESLAKEPERIDFLRLYIPSNPFYSLANATIPAIVLFSILIGLALIGVRRKDSLLETLAAFAEALTRVTSLIAKLAPIGVFALTAGAAGTMEIEDLGRLQVYLVIYGVFAIVLSIWVLPALVAAVTPLSYGNSIKYMRGPLITAFATGSILVVLPLLADRAKQLLGTTEEYTGEAGEDARASVDVLVPTFYNFPTLGIVLALSFIPFSGWYIGSPLSLADYPMLIGAGLASLFGGTVLAIPFVLELLRLPGDLFQAFLTVDVLGARFAALLGAAHVAAIALVGTCAIQGMTRVRLVKIVRFAVVTVAIFAVVLVGVRAFYGKVLVVPYTKDEALSGLFLLREPHTATVFRESPSTDEYSIGQPRTLAQILDSGVFRVCYVPDDYPMAFFNNDGDLVGFNIEMTHMLARRLDLRTEFLPMPQWQERLALLDSGYCDIQMTLTAIGPESSLKSLSTKPVDTFSAGFMVPDHRREDFESWDEIRGAGEIQIGGVTGELVRNLVGRILPQAKFTVLQSSEGIKEFLSSENKRFDGIFGPAEEIAAWTILYPRFTVVVPRPAIRLPVGYSLPLGSHELVRTVDDWLIEMEQSGRIDELHDFWIGGKIEQVRPPRWSVIRDVLGWIQ